MSSRRFVVTVAAVAVALTLAGRGVLSAQDDGTLIKDSCQVGYASFAASNVRLSLDARGDWADVPGTSVPVGSKAETGCLLVSFSLQRDPGADILLRAVLNDAIIADPVDAYGGAVNLGATISYTFNFVFPNVPSGVHTVKMQFLGARGEVLKLTSTLIIVHSDSKLKVKTP